MARMFEQIMPMAVEWAINKRMEEEQEAAKMRVLSADNQMRLHRMQQEDEIYRQQSEMDYKESLGIEDRRLKNAIAEAREKYDLQWQADQSNYYRDMSKIMATRAGNVERGMMDVELEDIESANRMALEGLRGQNQQASDLLNLAGIYRKADVDEYGHGVSERNKGTDFDIAQLTQGHQTERSRYSMVGELLRQGYSGGDIPPGLLPTGVRLPGETGAFTPRAQADITRAQRMGLTGGTDPAKAAMDMLNYRARIQASPSGYLAPTVEEMLEDLKRLHVGVQGILPSGIPAPASRPVTPR